MHASTLFCSLLALAGSAVAFTPSPIRASSGKALAGRFIVEVRDEGLTKRGLNADDLLDTVLARLLHAPRVKATARKTYRDRPELFAGASITVDSKVTAEDILAVEGVERVWPVHWVPPPSPVAPSDAPNNRRNTAVTADELFTLSQDNNATLFRRGLLSTLLGVEGAADKWPPHVQGQVDVAHGNGWTGQGIKIGIIDTGVDYLNPILNYASADKPCFGPGCLISFGHDFVGDAYGTTDDAEAVEDDDPYTDCSDHGTHVAGIVAAQANRFGFSGVASGAEVGMYRVFGCDGGSGDDIIIEALIRAYTDGCDVVNLSLGSSAGWIDQSASQLLVAKLNGLGVVTTVSAGNERSEGLFWTDGPAATTTGLSVGSVDVTSLPAYSANILLRGTIPILTALPLPVEGTHLVYFLSTDSTKVDDGCDADALQGLPLAGKVVVIQRGSCAFTDKMSNVAAAGGRIVLIYNSATAGEMPYFGTQDTGLDAVGSLRREDGLKLLDFYKQNPRSLRMNFPTGPLADDAANTLSGGLVSSFSNSGPTNELYGQPSLTAPGGSILSTVPLSFGGVDILSGTSMAAPYLAGTAGILLSQRKSEQLTPEQVRGLLATTAKYTTDTVGGSTVESTVLQGGGLVQIVDAVNAKTLISPFELTLNDTAYFNGVQTLTLENRAPHAVKYTFAHVVSRSLAVYDGPATSAILPSLDPQTVDSSKAATVTFSTRVLTVGAGQKATVKVTIKAPTFSSANIARFPIYSGFIIVNQAASGLVKAQRYSVPYFGVANAMSNAPVLDSTSTYSRYYAQDARYPFLTPDMMTIQTRDNSLSYTKANGATIFARLAQGSRKVNIDLVSADSTFVATIPSTNNANVLQVTRRRALPTSPASHHPHEASLSAPLPIAHDFSFGANSTLPAEKLERRAAAGALYSATPIIGRIYTATELPRDYAVENTPNPWSDLEYTWDGRYQPNPSKTATVLAVNKKAYRVLIRALRITADPTLESSWDSWLSPAFSFSS